MTELWQLDATDLARLIRLGRVSAQEATRSCLDRLHTVNPTINAVVRVLEDEALEAAREADNKRARGDALGPLHGVPVPSSSAAPMRRPSPCVSSPTMRCTAAR